MADRSLPVPASLAVDVEMTVTQTRRDTAGQSFAISTESDGTVRIASHASFPKASWRELREARMMLRHFVSSTGQSIVIEHSGQELAKLSPSSLRSPKWSIHWPTIIRGWIFNS